MQIRTTAACGGLAAAMLAGPALADVTPDQVWSDLRGYLESSGYTVAATETTEGDTLTVSDVTLTVPMDEEGDELTVTMDRIAFTDAGDGTVDVDFPATMPITITAEDEDGEPVEAQIDYTQEGLEMLVSGDPGALTYAYSAETLRLALSRLVVEGEELDREAVRAEARFGPVEGETSVTTAEGTREIAQTMALGDFVYDVAAANPEDDEGSFSLSGTMRGVSGESTSTLPEEMPEDPAAVLAAGLSGTGSFSHEGGRVAFSFEDEEDSGGGEITSEAASLEVDFSGDAIAYAMSGQMLDYSLSGSGLPFPVNVSMETLALNIAAPLAESDQPEDVAMGLTLGGFTMSDMIWNIFDPGQVLPRDPATVAMDMTGTVTPQVNLYDPADMAQLETGEVVPAELNALTLNSLTIDAAGLQVAGEGAFTFDNSDTETFDGMPRPDGEVTVRVTGANALIDRLIQMGLLTERDAMGARMMLSMFGVPGDSPDTLTSTIEVNEQGHVLANGQRIQ
ncbi:DUF2125 domain-containing protein [Salipiger mucosus]|uniref:DUF2125 domain-containing protein n=1 Tax=Salipiger mucosus DSM 16094 TaxID=1123237 RepID=S9R500_9RHOB|nr:DUF2125 domain-containing protein [Salipiger mucosus]EPX87043.1 hypothetical protein Salmuc_03018 [Salipiger mucosus DSM 16094]